MKAVTWSPDPALRAESPGVTWVDAARVDLGRSLDSLQLARACFEGAARPMRLFLTWGWVLLLLQGPARSDDRHVLGWPVVRPEPVTVLRRRSRWGMDATLVFCAADGVGSFSSGMAFSGRTGRFLWMAVGPLHRWAVRSVLTRVAQSTK